MEKRQTGSPSASATVAILNVGAGTMACIKRPAYRRGYAASSLDLLPASKPAGRCNAPFSADLTLWLSRSRRLDWPRPAARGTSHRALREAIERLSSSTGRNNRRVSSAPAGPSDRSPLASRLRIYISPLTTSRSSIWRRLPPRLAGGSPAPHEPLGIRQIARIPQSAAVIPRPIFVRPHRAPP